MSGSILMLFKNEELSSILNSLKLGSYAQFAPGCKFAPRVYFLPCERCFKNLHPCENLHCIGCKFAPTFGVEQIYLDPGTNLHPGANCAYEHGLSVVVSKLQPSVCGNPWPDPESFDPPPLSCLDLIIQHEKSVIHNGQLKHSDLS